MLIKFYNTLLKYPKAILLATLATTIFFGYCGLKLKIDASSETLFLADDKDLAFYRDVSKNFSQNEQLVITYTPKRDMLSRDSLIVLSNIIKDIEKLSLTDSVDSILTVPLLQSPPRDFGEAIENVTNIQSGKADLKLAKKEFLSSPIYAENLVSKDFKSSAIIINLKYDKRYYELLNKRNALYNLKKQNKLSDIQKIEYRNIEDEFNNYREISKEKNHQYILNLRNIISKYQNVAALHLGGANMIADDMMEFVKNDIKIFGFLVFLLITISIWFIFRNYRWVAIALSISLASIVITAGLISLMGYSITVVSSNFVLLQIVLTMPLVMHMFVRFIEITDENPNLSKSDSIILLLKDMGQPAFYVAITNVAGFGSLVTSDMIPIADYGIMMSIGAMVFLAVIFIIMPAFLMITANIKSTFKDTTSSINTTIANIIKKRTYLIFASIAIVIIFSLFGATKLFVENSFINYFKKDTEIYKGMKFLDQNLGGTTPLDIVITFKEKNTITPIMEKSSETFFDDFENEYTLSSNDKKRYWLTKEKLDTVQKVHKYLESIPQIGKVTSLSTINDIGTILKNGKELDSLDLTLMSNKLPQKYKKILLDPYINIDKNQIRITTRVIDSDPTLKRDLLLKKINHDLSKMINPNIATVKTSNLLVLYNNVLQSLFDSQIKTLGFALLTIFAMFLALFKNIKLSFIGLAVNSVPIAVLFGIMGYLRIPLDIMSITIAAISIGITVDNTIHYFHRFGEELNQNGYNYTEALFATHKSTGVAVFFAGAIVVIGYSILTLSNFIPTVYFGLLTIAVIGIATIDDLFLTPALLIIFKPFKKKK